LFHAAWFVQWTGQFDTRNTGAGGGQPRPHPTQDASAVHLAIVGRDPEAAALVNGFRGPRAELERSLMEAAAEDHSTAPITVAQVRRGPAKINRSAADRWRPQSRRTRMSGHGTQAE
jgi:hypothetical protein